MNVQAKFGTDLTVRSFAYVARQLAKTSTLAPSALYAQILGEAEKHRSAIRLVQRDAFEMAERGLRKQTLTKTEYHQLLQTVTQTATQAQQDIARIAEQYAPQKLAA